MWPDAWIFKLSPLLISAWSPWGLSKIGREGAAGEEGQGVLDGSLVEKKVQVGRLGTAGACISLHPGHDPAKGRSSLFIQVLSS